MEDEVITQDTLDKLEIFTSNDYNTESILYFHGKDLYKVFLNNFIMLPIKEKLVDHLLINPLHRKFIVEPKARLIKDNMFCGYVMRYVKNSCSICNYVNNESCDIDTRISYLYDLNGAIKYLHSKNIIYGDIHQGNIIVDQNHSYLVDIDSLKIKDISDDLFSLFRLKDHNRDIAKKEEDKNTDIIKMHLMFLSLLYQCDFESLYFKTGLSFIRDIVDALKLPKIIKEDLNKNMILGNDCDYLNERLGNIGKYEKSLILSDSIKLKKLIKSKIN